MLILLIITVIISGCGGGGGGSGGSTSPASSNNLGTLPNGSSVISSSSSFSAPTSGAPVTGTLNLQGGNSNAIYNFKFIVTSSIAQAKVLSTSLPTVTTSPSPCQISSGGSCTLSFNGDNASIGTYQVTPIATNITSGESTILSNIQLVVTGSGQNPGSLAVSLSKTALSHPGESLIATISLTNSNNVESLPVNISSTTQGLVSLSNTNCILSSNAPNNSCQVIITATNESGSTEIKATANNYADALSSTFAVNTDYNPGYLTFNHSNVTLVHPGVESTITLSLSASSNVQNFVVNLESIANESGAISFSPSSCMLSSANPDCDIAVTSITAGNSVLKASAVGYVNTDASITMLPDLYFGLYNGTIFKNNILLPGNITTAFIPEQGIINSVIVNNNVVYAATNDNVWKMESGIWQEVGGGSPVFGFITSMAISKSTGTVYIGGYNFVTDRSTVWFEGNGGWQVLGGASPTRGEINSLVVDGNTVYASNILVSRSNIYNTVWMYNGIWQIAGGRSPVRCDDGVISSIAINTNTGVLYAGGYDCGYGNVWQKESGSTWHPLLESGPTGQYGDVSLITVSNNTVYAAGSDTGTIYNKVWVESGSTWQSIGESVPITNGNKITAMAINNGTVYVSASESHSSNNNNVWAYNGSQWQIVGNVSPSGQAGVINSLAISNGTIYAGGYDSNNNSYLWAYNGSLWNYAGIGSNSSIDGTPIVGVTYDSTNTSVYAATASNVWKNSNSGWQQVGGASPITQSGEISSLAVSESIVYAAGQSSNYGYVWAESDSGWRIVGGTSPTGLHGAINYLAVSGGTIYAGGMDSNNHATVWMESGFGWQIVGNSSLTEQSESIIAVAVNGNKIYAATISNIWVESGSGWKVVMPDNPIGYFACITSIAASGDKIYVGGYNNSSFGDVGRIWVTDNSTWQEVSGYSPDNSFVTSIMVLGTSVYAATLAGNIWLSINDRGWMNLSYGASGVPAFLQK
mgnify:CR=1 FL=1